METRSRLRKPKMPQWTSIVQILTSQIKMWIKTKWISLKYKKSPYMMEIQQSSIMTLLIVKILKVDILNRLKVQMESKNLKRKVWQLETKMTNLRLMKCILGKLL